MSVDAEVWTAMAVSLSELIGDEPGWEVNEWEAAFEGDGWQVLVSEPEEADRSEAPPEIAARLVADARRIAVTLEPIGAK